MTRIFLIEKAWGDPLENRDDFGYSIVGFVEDENEARRIADESGDVPDDFTWSVRYLKPRPKMMRYRAVERFTE